MCLRERDPVILELRGLEPADMLELLGREEW